MKFLLISVVAICVSVAAANVVVNSLSVEDNNKIDVERQETALPDVTAPPKKCTNATVNIQDCQSVIVTRLPFLFNFMNLNRVCSCEDGALQCDRGVGANVLQRLQIPALRLVYNSNCKCKCQAPIPELPETTTATVVVV